MIDCWADAADRALFGADAARLEAVRADRAEAAARYFAAHAEVWDQIRSLHVAESEVEQAIERALGERPLGRLVDIGTGTGRMIELFGAAREPCDRHRPLVGDAAPGPGQAGSGGDQPRAFARATCTRFRWPTSSADSIIIHQVLHYAHSPAAAIAEAARVLSPGGTLLIVDFAAHEREELREQRRPYPPGLRRRGDGRLVRRGRACASTMSSISRAAS